MVVVLGMGVDDMMEETIEEQNQVSPWPLYVSDQCMDQLQL
jgi:hypothetical protein